jgi:hypothetical protein
MQLLMMRLRSHLTVRDLNHIVSNLILDERVCLRPEPIGADGDGDGARAGGDRIRGSGGGRGGGEDGDRGVWSGGRQCGGEDSRGGWPGVDEVLDLVHVGVRR